MSGEIVPTADLRPALWAAKALWEWQEQEPRPVRVGSIVPARFEAYARIFNPPQAGERTLRWAELAAARGIGFTAETAWWQIAHPDAAPTPPVVHYEDDAPLDGSLPEPLLRTLAAILNGFTSTSDRCWYCLWDGYGKPVRPWWRWPPRLHAPARSYVVFAGPLQAITSFSGGMWDQSPNLWWPDDRAWCVATEIDGFSTFVGASRLCVTAILEEPQLEALPTRADARGDFWIGQPRDDPA